MKPQISSMVMGIYVTTLTKFTGPFVVMHVRCHPSQCFLKPICKECHT